MSTGEGKRTYRLQVPYLPDTVIAERAHLLRHLYETERGSPAYPLDTCDIIWSLLDPQDRLSLDVEARLGFDDKGEKIVGCMGIEEHGGIIAIDASIVDTPLMPFTVAHEIGHWILHRPYLEACLQQGCLFTEEWPITTTLKRHVEASSSMRLPAEEYQANRFAVHLLLPEEAVRQAFRQRFGEHAHVYEERCSRIAKFKEQFPSLREYSSCLARDRVAGFRFSLKDFFGTSTKSMAIRLEELGLVVENSPSPALRF